MREGESRRHVLFWSIAAAGLLLDLASKSAVFAWLGEPSQCRPRQVIGELLVLRTAYNTGTFFGMGAEMSWFNTGLIVFTLVMAALILYMYIAPPKESRGRAGLYTVSLALVFAGAVGNLYDRIAFDRVRDFVDVGLGASRRWPTFNLADAWLCVGVLAYLVTLILTGRKKGAGEEPAAARAGAAPEGSGDE